MTLPVRTCVGCRAQRPQSELVRCTFGADGSVRIDRSAPGRGAWLCRGSVDCFERAVRRRGFERAWRRPVPTAVLDRLRVLLEADHGTLSGTNEHMEDLLAAGVTPGSADVMKD